MPFFNKLALQTQLGLLDEIGNNQTLLKNFSEYPKKQYESGLKQLVFVIGGTLWLL